MSIKVKNGIEISPSGYLFNTQTGESFVLNATGAEIMEYLRIGMNTENIADKMSEERKIDKYRLLSDLEDYLYLLKQYELITDEE